MMTSDNTNSESGSTGPLDSVSKSLERIVGTRPFDDVLYSEAYIDRITPDSLFPGERAFEIEQNVKTARRIGINGPDQVLVPRGHMTFTGNNPFASVVFFDQMVVGGRQLRHRRGPALFENNGFALEQLYRAAVGSDRYAVELVEANYETGSVTISVEETGEA